MLRAGRDSGSVAASRLQGHPGPAGPDSLTATARPRSWCGPLDSPNWLRRRWRLLLDTPNWAVGSSAVCLSWVGHRLDGDCLKQADGGSLGRENGIARKQSSRCAAQAQGVTQSSTGSTGSTEERAAAGCRLGSASDFKRAWMFGPDHCCQPFQKHRTLFRADRASSAPGTSDIRLILAAAGCSGWPGPQHFWSLASQQQPGRAADRAADRAGSGQVPSRQRQWRGRTQTRQGSPQPPQGMHHVPVRAPPVA